MTSFFESLEPEVAEEIENLSRLAYEVRENRAVVLRSYAVPDEAALLENIRSGALAEHPAYEHYLAARILEDMRETARELMAQRLKEATA